MTFNLTHFGLFFGQQQMDEALAMRASTARRDAWAQLEKRDADQPRLQQIMRLAYRYRLLGDVDAGAQAIPQLPAQAMLPDAPLLDQIRLALSLAHLHELLRDHPAYTDANVWRAAYADETAPLLQAAAEADCVLDCWQVALRIARGVVLADAERFEQGVTRFKQLVDAEIHPEGYLRSAVAGKDGMTLYRQVLCVAGLVLAAEAAYHAGTDLWAYEHRGVGVGTAAAYIVYYYFYPEKWRWDEGISTDDTEALFRQHGAFIEIATYRKPARGVEHLLAAQRPMFDVYGGFTTLTHGPEPKKKRSFRLF